MIIDTHCHLDFSEFDFDRDAVVQRAKDARVGGIINVGSSLDGSRRSVQLAKDIDIVFASVGIHPHYASDIDNAAFEEVEKLTSSVEVVAIGEVGLDYYRNPASKDDQKRRFKDFLNLSKEKGLPIIIHSRDAHEDTLEILKAFSPENRLNGVMHCFSGGEEDLKKYLGMGLFVSFTCNLTFKNAKKLREVAKKIPPERLLLETDAPFLAPQQFRGKRNEPSYLPYLIKEWSGILGLSEADIGRITTQNARALFKLPIQE